MSVIKGKYKPYTNTEVRDSDGKLVSVSSDTCVTVTGINNGNVTFKLPDKKVFVTRENIFKTIFKKI